MKKILFTLLLLSLALGLCACSSTADDGIPEGYQRISTIDTHGFALYVPDTWTAYEMGDMVCAYASTFDRSSDRSSVLAAFTVSALSPKAYFEASAAEYTSMYQDYAFVSGSEKAHNGRDAYTADYIFSYQGTTYGVTQRIIDAGDGVLCVLTCQAVYDIKEGNETSAYANEQTTFASIQDYFEVGTPKIYQEPTFEGTAPEGMKRACDGKVFSAVLCVPTSWQVKIADGLVFAQAQDGTNVTFSEANPTVTDIGTYLAQMIEPLKVTYGEQNVTSLFTATAETAETLNGATAYRQELLVKTVQGNYQVTQYVIVAQRKIYLLTFTASEALAQTYAPVFTQIAQAVQFE